MFCYYKHLNSKLKSHIGGLWYIEIDGVSLKNIYKLAGLAIVVVGWKIEQGDCFDAFEVVTHCPLLVFE